MSRAHMAEGEPQLPQVSTHALYHGFPPLTTHKSIHPPIHLSNHPPFIQPASYPASQLAKVKLGCLLCLSTVLGTGDITIEIMKFGLLKLVGKIKDERTEAVLEHWSYQNNYFKSGSLEAEPKIITVPHETDRCIQEAGQVRVSGPAST